MAEDAVQGHAALAPSQPEVREATPPQLRAREAIPSQPEASAVPQSHEQLREAPQAEDETPGQHDGPPADPASRAARLGALEERVPPPAVDDVWLFPPLPEVEDSAEFFLFTSILGDGARALYSARMMPENGTPARQVIVEHGRAPADRVPRLVAELQRRLGQPTPAQHVPIGGDAARWAALLEQSLEHDGAAPDKASQ